MSFLIDEFDIFNYTDKEKIIINYLSGAMDIVSDEFIYKLKNNLENLNEDEINILKDRKYLFDSRNEKKKYEDGLYKSLHKKEDLKVPNFLYIPTYQCNFKCPYCYQETYEILNENELENNVDSFFKCTEEILNEFTDKNKVEIKKQDVEITLMGGEPLLIENKKQIHKFLKEVYKREYSLVIITNGYNIDFFINELEPKYIVGVQITLDGSSNVHNKRRILKNGEKTFDKILNNIVLLLEKGIKVYIRVNVDSENIEFLKKLEIEIKEKVKEKEYNIYPYLYLIQDGGCSGNKFVINEIEYLKKILKNKENYSFFDVKYHGKNFYESIINDKMVSFKTKNCASCSKQYIFDGSGNIYKCWFGVGNPIFKIGEYKKGLNLDKKLDTLWKSRDIHSLKKCTDCKYRFICGGGCLSHIIKSNEDIYKERCINFREIFNFLIQKEIKGMIQN